MTVPSTDRQSSVEGPLLPFLLGEGSPSFWREHWQRSILYSRATLSPTLELPALEDLDRLLASVQIPSQLLDLAKDSVPIPKSEYCLGAEVDRQKLFELHRRGATIILRACHKWDLSLQRLRARAEAEFGCEAQVNVYITPPGHQSTPPHWDTHDLFIVQIAGTKRWRIFDSAYRFPLPDQRFSEEAYEVGPLQAEIDLSMGDILYLPRGTIHEPRPESYSIHIALGILVPRVADVVMEMVRIASERQVDLRAAVPSQPWLSNEEKVPRILQEFSRGIQAIGTPETVLEALRRMRLRFLSSCDAPASGQLVAAAQPSGNQGIVGRRPEVAHELEVRDGRVVLLSSVGSISMPAHLGETLRFIATSESFSVADIPGDIDDECKAATVAALLESGFLEAKTSAR